MYKLINIIIKLLAVVAIGLIPYRVELSLWDLPIPILVIIIIEGGTLYFEFKEKYKVVRGQLLLLLNILSLQAGARVKCTFHKPIFFKKYIQTFDYLPNGGGGRRILPIKKGIVGLAFRKKKTFTENFQSKSDYHTKMISRYKFTEKDLEERDFETKSFLCVPIIDSNQKVIGLVYFDSNTKGTFKMRTGNNNYVQVKKSCEDIKTILLENKYC